MNSIFSKKTKEEKIRNWKNIERYFRVAGSENYRG